MPTVPRPRAFRSATSLSGRRTHLPWLPEVDRSTAIIDCAVYLDGVRQPGSPSWEQAHEQVVTSGSGFVWIGLHEPSARQLAGIAAHFGLHPLAVEDAVAAH